MEISLTLFLASASSAAYKGLLQVGISFIIINSSSSNKSSLIQEVNSQDSRETHSSNFVMSCISLILEKENFNSSLVLETHTYFINKLFAAVYALIQYFIFINISNPPSYAFSTPSNPHLTITHTSAENFINIASVHMTYNVPVKETPPKISLSFNRIPYFR